MRSQYRALREGEKSMQKNDTESREKTFNHHKGVTWFSRATERKVFFALTLAMLLWGIFAKLGIL